MLHFFMLLMVNHVRESLIRFFSVYFFKLSEGSMKMKIKPVRVRDLILGSGRPRICIPIVGVNEKDVIEQAEKIRKYPCHMVEFRADWYEGALDPERQKKLLLRLRDEDLLASMPILYTFRTMAEGGERQVSFDQYRSILLQVSRDHLADLIDVEGFFKGLPQGDCRVTDLIGDIHDHGLPLIVSSHDFDKTDDKDVLVERLKMLQSMGGDIIKIAVMPHSKEDVLQLLSAVIEMNESFARVPVAAMSMSDLGRISRVCGEWIGSCLTFASAGKSSAPGQLDAVDLDQMLELLHHS